MIKPLSKEDVKKITLLYGNDFADGWNENMLISSFDNGRFVAFGKFVDNALVGVITLTIGYDDTDLESIFVKRDSRRCGVAKELMNFALDYLEKENKSTILLEVRRGNFKAINLYKSFDFVDISVRKRYYSDGEDAIIMKRG